MRSSGREDRAQPLVVHDAGQLAKRGRCMARPGLEGLLEAEVQQEQAGGDGHVSVLRQDRVAEGA